MKKHFLILMATILAVSLLAGCGGTAGSSEAASSAPPAVSSSSQASSQEESSQEELPGEQSAPVEVKDDDGSGAAADGMSGKLADAYIGMISGDSYYMKYRSSEEFEGEKTDVVVEFALNGDSMAMISEMEGASMHMIFKDNKMYFVNDEEKIVLVMQSNLSQQGGTDPFPKSEFVFKGAGTGELFGTPRAYEEYGTDAGDVRFFFDGEKLAGFESSFEGMTMQMEILEMSKNIPAGMFDIPAGYEVQEY